MRIGTTLTAFLLAGMMLLTGTTGAAPPAFLVDLASSSEGSLSFTMRAGQKLIGYATDDGGFRLAVMPEAASVPLSASTGLEPTYECTNDVRSTYGTTYPLTATFTGAVLPNFASQAACTGAKGLGGPIASLIFSTSGDGGGGVELASLYVGEFSVWCGPAMTLAGAGVHDVWATTLVWEETTCFTSWSGSPPSAWWTWDGTVSNDHRDTGVTRAIVGVV